MSDQDEVWKTRTVSGQEVRLGDMVRYRSGSYSLVASLCQLRAPGTKATLVKLDGLTFPLCVPHLAVVHIQRREPT